MTFTFAKPEDKQALKAIYKVCFPGDSDSFWDFELDARMRSDNILIYRENGQVIATVQLLAEELILAGVAYPVQYIYAAATLPESQGRGIMGAMLRYAHELARERGQRFSVLITQNDSLFDFYARFEYQDCGKVGKLIATDNLDMLGTVRIAESSDIAQMLELYQNAQTDILSVSRTVDTFELQRLIYEKSVLVYQRNDRITAYGFRTGNNMLEVVGPDALSLLAQTGVKTGYTLPSVGMDLVRNGCVLPLDHDAAVLLKRQSGVIYLNLMWN